MDNVELESLGAMDGPYLDRRAFAADRRAIHARDQALIAAASVRQPASSSRRRVPETAPHVKYRAIRDRGRDGYSAIPP